MIGDYCKVVLMNIYPFLIKNEKSMIEQQCFLFFLAILDTPNNEFARPIPPLKVPSSQNIILLNWNNISSTAMVCSASAPNMIDQVLDIRISCKFVWKRLIGNTKLPSLLHQLKSVYEDNFTLLLNILQLQDKQHLVTTCPINKGS